MATASQIIQIVPADGWYFVRTVTGNELPVVDSIAVWALDSAGNVSGLIGQVQSGPDNVSPCAKLVSLPPTTGSFKHFRNLSSQERLSANSATLLTDEGLLHMKMPLINLRWPWPAIRKRGEQPLV